MPQPSAADSKESRLERKKKKKHVLTKRKEMILKKEKKKGSPSSAYNIQYIETKIKSNEERVDEVDKFRFRRFGIFFSLSI